MVVVSSAGREAPRECERSDRNSDGEVAEGLESDGGGPRERANLFDDDGRYRGAREQVDVVRVQSVKIHRCVKMEVVPRERVLGVVDDRLRIRDHELWSLEKRGGIDFACCEGVEK